MKFKRIVLENFRQYLGIQEVVFSTDENKNITILRGDNLTGKTTFIQSFYWCFYGDLDLPNKKDIANRQKVNSMRNGEYIKTAVKIEFIHENVDYSIERIWKYRKINDTSPTDSGLDKKPEKMFFFTKVVDGVTKDVNERELGKIFPNDLSKYFLFDGERLKHMMSPGKNTDVSDAVKTILGLGLLEDAINHLKNVQKDFFKDRKQFSESNEEYSKKYKEKERLQDEKSEIENNINKFKKDIEECEDKIFELDSQLDKLQEIRKFQTRKKEIEKELESLERHKETNKNNMLKNINNNFISYLISKTLSTHADILNLGFTDSTTISGLHGTAIQEIIDRETCICGTKIKEGSQEHQNLIDQLKYQPPASKAVISKGFIDKAKMFEKTATNFIDGFFNNEEILDDIEQKIEELQIENNELKKKVSAYDDGDILQSKRDRYIEEKGKLNEKISIASDELYKIDNAVDQISRDLSRLSKTNEKDALLALREDYCKELIKSLSTYYQKKEEDIYKKLSSEVQNIFKQIIGTKHRISIDPADYSYSVSNKSGAQGASTGGDIMVAMSFIAGIIKVAKANDKTLLNNEPYPLVLDAPFSNLDPTRKTRMGKIIPSIAEQLILITFDELNGVIDDKVGYKYNIVAKEEEHTEIEKVI